MKRMKLLVAVVLALTICLPGMAGAVTTVGDPITIGSWAQGFNETGVGKFTKLEVFMLTPGIDFEAPGFSNFNASGWTTSMPNPDYVLSGNPAGSTNLTWNIQFTSAKTTPLFFDFLAWNGETLLEAVHASWSGGAWSFTVFTQLYDGSNYDRTDPPSPRAAVIPLPPSAFLLGTGLLGLVGLGWRRRKSS